MKRVAELDNPREITIAARTLLIKLVRVQKHPDEQHFQRNEFFEKYIMQTLKKACLQGYPEGAVCVQDSIGSRNSAIHNAYRTSLRPSSSFEPRHPSLKVVYDARGGGPPKAKHIYKCSSTNNGSFTVTEDGPILIHYPRTHARVSR